jgi:uncharacterized membrane protein
MRQERIFSSPSQSAEIVFATPWSAIEKLLLAALCIATLFFTIVTPPFQAPDENQHYMKALLLSEGRILTEQRGTAIGADLPRAAMDLRDVDFPPETPGHLHRYDYGQIIKAATADGDRLGKTFANFPNVANYAPTLYAPGAAGLLIGDAIGLPRMGAFYLGRLVNAVFALAMLVVALRLMPFGRAVLLAVALLPTTAYQGGSLSPDAVINGLGFLGLALALRMGFAPPTFARGVALFLVGPLLALAKGVYLPVMAAGLRLPTGRRDIRSWLVPGLMLIAMLLSAVSFVAWQKYSGGSQALYHIVSRKTGELVMTAPLGEQLAVILGDPLGYVRILLSSVIERAPVYLLQIVGRFGWNAILLPLLAYPLAGVMLASAIASGAGVHFSVMQRLWWLAVVLGTALLIETAMYLTGTPPAADYIQGTQGRYFLPVLPLALLALMPDRGLRLATPLFAVSALLLLAVAALTVFVSFWVHGFITHDGMPPHSSAKNALLLPSPRW